MGPWRPTRKALIVSALLIAALAVRVAEIERTSYRPVNDAGSYLVLASQIAHTGDYSSARGAGGTRGPTAYFPPGFPYFLAAVDLIDGNTTPRGGAVSPHGSRRRCSARSPSRWWGSSRSRPSARRSP